MRFDLSLLYRSGAGFERLTALLDRVSEAAHTRPPYNIVRTRDDAYRIVMAAPGFFAHFGTGGKCVKCAASGEKQ